MKSRSRTFKKGCDWYDIVDWVASHEFIQAEQKERNVGHDLPPEPWEEIQHTYRITITKVEDKQKKKI